MSKGQEIPEAARKPDQSFEERSRQLIRSSKVKFVGLSTRYTHKCIRETVGHNVHELRRNAKLLPWNFRTTRVLRRR